MYTGVPYLPKFVSETFISLLAPKSQILGVVLDSSRRMFSNFMSLCRTLNLWQARIPRTTSRNRCIASGSSSLPCLKTCWLRSFPPMYSIMIQTCRCSSTTSRSFTILASLTLLRTLVSYAILFFNKSCCKTDLSIYLIATLNWVGLWVPKYTLAKLPWPIGSPT